ASSSLRVRDEVVPHYELDAILARALATDPSDRYATAADFARALDRVPVATADALEVASLVRACIARSSSIDEARLLRTEPYRAVGHAAPASTPTPSFPPVALTPTTTTTTTTTTPAALEGQAKIKSRVLVAAPWAIVALLIGGAALSRLGASSSFSSKTNTT